MPESSDDNAPPSIPREWLPKSIAAPGAVEWETRVERIIAAAEPRLQQIGRPTPTLEPSWWSALGWWWKPAAVLATAAAALLLVLEPRAAPRKPAPDSLSLSVVAAEGELGAMWELLGIEADPVLALIALQEQGW